MKQSDSKKKSAPLTPEDIETAIRALRARDEELKTHKIYAELGFRGSLSTISKYMKQRLPVASPVKDSFAENLSAQLQAEISAIKEQAYKDGFQEGESDLQELYSTLEEERARLKVRTDAIEFERAQLVAEIERLIKQYTDMKLTHDGHVHERIQLEQKAAALGLQAEHNSQQLQREKTRHEMSVSDLKQQLADANAVYTKTIEDIQVQHQRDRDALKEINEKQRQQHMLEKDRLTVELAKAQSATKQLERENLQLKNQQQSNEQNIKRLSLQIQESERANNTLKENLDAAQSELTETKSDMRLTSMRHEELEKHKFLLETQVKQLTSTIQCLEQQLKHSDIADVN